VGDGGVDGGEVAAPEPVIIGEAGVAALRALAAGDTLGDGLAGYPAFCELLDADASAAAEAVFALFDADAGGRGLVRVADVLLGLASFAPGAAVAAREGRLAERLRLCFALSGAGAGGLDRPRLTRLLRGTLFAASDREVSRKADTLADAGGDKEGFVSLEAFASVLQRFPGLVFPYGVAAVVAGA
jgi:hypothetical protein